LTLAAAVLSYPKVMLTLVEFIVRRSKSLGVRSRSTESALRLLHKQRSIAASSMATHGTSLPGLTGGYYVNAMVSYCMPDRGDSVIGHTELENP
jgi:hypothetical protein